MHYYRGFSLVELSIVLVILGLITGGILTGQSLIKAAQLRTITTELNNYQIAVSSFKDKYDSLPGDMTNATSFWGKIAAECNGHAGTASATGTCNGDGDGVLDDADAAGNDGEIYTFWQQLALARMIEGTFTGIAGNGNDDEHIIGTNAPASRFTNAGWSVDGDQAGNSILYSYTYGNTLSFGMAITNDDTQGPALTPEDAWNIDKKIDDGQPAYGKVLAIYWNNLCAAANDGTHANNDYAASYKVSDTTIRCALLFKDSLD
jgi:prepilin-type N-terminal cleavage/methylation domain-containing protein